GYGFDHLEPNPPRWAPISETKSMVTNSKNRPQRRRSQSFDGRNNGEQEPRNRSRPRTWILLRLVDPSGLIKPIAMPENPVHLGINLGNYFFEQGLNKLIEKLTKNERTGPPPVANFVINVIPIVKITGSHLVINSHCPVCKEEFKVGGEAQVTK